MSGIFLAAAAGRPRSIMTVDSASYIEDYGGGPTTFYDAGFIGDGAALALAPLIGELTEAYFGGGNIVALYWQSTTNFSSNGQSYIEIRGNRSAGFVTSVKLDGVSLGAIGGPQYFPLQDVTRFALGAGASANPFGTTGTKAVEVL